MAVTYNRMEIEINVKPEDIITAVQDDSDSRYLDVFLFDNGVPIDLTGCEVRIYMRKPEKGGEILNNGEITEPENGRCQFLLTAAALEKTGYLKTQISIWKDNREILSTQIFNIFVTESLRTTGSIEGSNEYGALVVLFQNLYESMDLMTDMVQNFGKAGEVAAGIPAGTFWQMLEAVYAVNKDALENASVSEVLNRIGLTGDTGGIESKGTVMAKLNALIGITPKVVCKGYMGTVFTLSRSDKYYKDIVTEITEDSVSVGNDLYINVIPVPLGNWNIKIDVNGMTINTSINVAEIGKVYTFSYSSYKTIAEFSSPGTYSVKIPDDVSEIYLDAAGAGGGGSVIYASGDGRGGGGGAAVANEKYTVTPGSTIQVTVGTKGSGTNAETADKIAGTDGTATVVGNLVTLPGGLSGDNGGTKGGTGGGNGGAKGAYHVKGGNGANGVLGSGGNGGTAKSGYQQPGGGGGSYGSGGNAGDAYPATDGKNGSKGGGGGAAGPNKNGGDGGDGYVRIKHGIQVNA